MDLSIHHALNFLGVDISKASEIARKILNLSDYFIDEPNRSTPWEESWAVVAYLSYFLPLNSVRLSAVMKEGQRFGFFNGIDHVIDFGAGPGTATLTMAESLDCRFSLIEKSSVPINILKKSHSLGSLLSFNRSYKELEHKADRRSLVVFSYSLTEIPELPSWTYDAEAVMIIEPSVQSNGRRLLEIRKDLINKGYFIYAPCTHQKACPLLTNSKKDWCHDRIDFDRPKWFQNIEEHLPMRNSTLTMSYLLARKTTPTLANNNQIIARTVGDLLIEKGKSRQLVCRSEEREFLAWLDRGNTRQVIPRGVLLEVPGSLPKVSNEIRVNQELKII